MPGNQNFVGTCNNNHHNNQLNGPPPSYEIVVALDEMQRRGHGMIKKCHHLNCPLNKYPMNECEIVRGGGVCDEDVKNFVTIEDMEFANGEEVLMNTNHKEDDDDDNVNKNGNSMCNINSLNNNLCDCDATTTMFVAMIPQQRNATLCRNCGEMIDGDDTNCNQTGGNKCLYNYLTSVSNPNGQVLEETGDTLDQMLHDIANNNNTIGPNTEQINNDMMTHISMTTTQTTSNNIHNNNNDHDQENTCNISGSNHHATNCTNNNNNNGNSGVDLRTFNENGLIRLDMSQIIDSTGLPTYEAALKLEASGYV